MKLQWQTVLMMKNGYSLSLSIKRLRSGMVIIQGILIMSVTLNVKNYQNTHLTNFHESTNSNVSYSNLSWKAFTAKLGLNNFSDVGTSISTKNLLWNIAIVNKTVKLVITIWCACKLKLKFWLVYRVIDYFHVCRFTAESNIPQKNNCCLMF